MPSVRTKKGRRVRPSIAHREPSSTAPGPRRFRTWSVPIGQDNPLEIRPPVLLEAAAEPVVEVEIESESPLPPPFEQEAIEPVAAGLEDVQQIHVNEMLARAFRLYEPELREALVELYDVQAEAQREGDKIPSDLAVENAERILIDLYRASPRVFAIDPLPEGEVSIDAATKFGTALVVICRSDGSAQCLADFDDEYYSRDYPNSDMLPDDFLRDALRITDASSD